jgi:alpha-tubulin suppressor-like RCC1 family protein
MLKTFLKVPATLGLLAGILLPAFHEAHAISKEENFPRIAAGFNHSVAYKVDGSAFAWGYNYYGALGDGTKKNSYVIDPVKLDNVAYMAAGKYHTLAVKNDGTVFSFGQNTYGKLGDGTTITRLLPVQVKDLTGVKTVSAGDNHSLALKSDGTVYAWGVGSYGVLGIGSTVSQKLPVQVKNLTDVSAISSGNLHNLALTSNGDVYAWGYNGSGQLGTGNKINSLVPLKVPGLSDIIAISAGNNYSLAVKRDGSVYAWGNNTYGKLGDNTTTMRLSPVKINVSNATDVAAGFNHSVILLNDGTVLTMGQNSYGQLGDGTTTYRKSPVKVSGLTNVVSIAAGAYHTMAVKDDATVVAFGQNSYGKLGDGTTTLRKLPVQVKALSIVFPNDPIDATTIEQPVDNVADIPTDETSPTTESNIPDGQIFNHSFDVVLYATDDDSGVDKTYYSINGADFTEGNQFTVDTEGVNQIQYYSVDLAGNVEDTNTAVLNIDKTSPTTSANVGNGLYNDDVSVDLSAVDHETSVDKTYYSIDGALEVSGNHFILQNEGIHHVNFYSVDIAGNKEDVKTMTITIDKTSPMTKSNVSNDWYKNDASIDLFASDNLSGVSKTFYSIDNSIFVEGNHFVINEEGIHHVSFYSVDNAGNIESVNTMDIKLDKTAPISSSNIHNDWYKEDVHVQLYSSDDLSGVDKTIYSIDGLTCIIGNDFIVSKEGIHTINYYSMDKAGNVESSKTVTLKIDKTAPVTLSNVSQGWYKDDAKILLTSSDAITSVAKTFYSVDNGVFTEGNNSIISDEGIHTIAFYSVDAVGNIENVHYATVKIDKSKPIVTLDLQNQYALGTKLSINYKATDNLSGISSEHLTFNGQEILNGTLVTLSNTGINHVKVVVTDNAGWVTTIEKDILIYVPGTVSIEPKVIKVNGGVFTVKVDVPTGFKNNFVLSSVKLNGVSAISKSNGDINKASNGMFQFNREDFNWSSGMVNVEFKGTLATGETVIGYTTVEVK